jgi:hypothetical protein
MKLITKEIERDGHLRAAYYKFMFDGSPKMVVSRKSAASLRPEEAEMIARQLNQMFGGGFEVVDADGA